MKKIILVCTLSLLSTTASFAGWKDKARSAYHKTEEFVEYNLSQEKIDTSLEEAKEAIIEAFDKTEEWLEYTFSPEKIESTYQKIKNAIEYNLSEEKIESTLDRANEAILHAFNSAKETAEGLKAPTLSAINKAKQHGKNIDLPKIETILTKTKEISLAAIEKAKQHYLDLDAEKTEARSAKAKGNVNNFNKKHGKTSFKPEQHPRTNSEYLDMCDEYSLFITSCMYLTVLNDMANKDEPNTSNTINSDDATLGERVVKMNSMLDQLGELMEIQSSNYSTKENGSQSSQKDSQESSL